MAKCKKRNIKFLIMDVDGVLTDGSIYVDHKGNESIRFSRIDGKGLELLRNSGVRLGVISQENVPAVLHRLRKLKIDIFSLGEKEKTRVYEKWKLEYKLKDAEICVCGDDLNDLPLLKRAGLSCAPVNALPAVKSNADFVSALKGGEGFVREVCEMLIRAKAKGHE